MFTLIWELWFISVNWFMQTVDCESVKIIHIYLMLPMILGPCNDLITIIVENNILLHHIYIYISLLNVI